MLMTVKSIKKVEADGKDEIIKAYFDSVLQWGQVGGRLWCGSVCVCVWLSEKKIVKEMEKHLCWTHPCCLSGGNF